jgi:hypothetical protein
LLSLLQGTAPAWQPVSGLQSKGATLLGEAANSPLRVIDPIGRAVASAQVQFRWTSAVPALPCRVVVADADLNVVAQSPLIRTGSWTAPALPPGRVYRWTITAEHQGQSFTAPLPTEPEARFAIPAAALLQRYEAAVAAASPLRIWAAANAAGLEREATTALAQLRRANPTVALFR